MSAIIGGETAHALQIERLVMSRAEGVVLGHERSVVRREVSFAVENCLKDSLPLLYKEQKPPVPKVREMGSRIKKLQLSMMAFDKKKSKIPTRFRSGEKEGVRKAEGKEMRVELNEEAVGMVGTDRETEIIKGVETENVKEVVVEYSDEVEKEMKEKNIVDTVLTGFGAA